MTATIRPELHDVTRRRLDVGQVWTVDGLPAARWFVLTPTRVIALCAGAADHTPRSLVYTYGDRLRLEQIATVYADSVKPDPTNGASIIPGLIERVQWAARQCDAALEDTRIDGAAAAWLRTIHEGLVNESGDVAPEPPASDEPARCEHGETDAHELWDDAWPMERKLAADAGCPGPAASGTPDGGQR